MKYAIALTPKQIQAILDWLPIDDRLPEVQEVRAIVEAALEQTQMEMEASTVEVEHPDCPHCGGDSVAFGKTKKGMQRFRCRSCGKTFTPRSSQRQPNGGFCTLCGSRAKKSGNRNGKPYSCCTSCGYTFPTQDLATEIETT